MPFTDIVINLQIKCHGFDVVHPVSGDIQGYQHLTQCYLVTDRYINNHLPDRELNPVIWIPSVQS